MIPAQSGTESGYNSIERRFWEHKGLLSGRMKASTPHLSCAFTPRPQPEDTCSPISHSKSG